MDDTTGFMRAHVIHDAIQSTREEPLEDWAAVAIWQDGEVSVLGESAPLQLKGYLHSGVWKIAHTEGTAGRAAKPATRSAVDVRDFPLGHMHVVRIGGASIGRGTFEPGWRWSDSIAPLVGTHSCPLEHVGVLLKGRMHIRMDTGAEFEFAAGDAMHLSAGHDAWVVGDEPCEVLEMLSAEEYARPAVSPNP